MSDITQKPQGVAVKPKMFARKLLGVKSDIADGNSNLNLTTAVALRPVGRRVQVAHPENVATRGKCTSPAKYIGGKNNMTLRRQPTWAQAQGKANNSGAAEHLLAVLTLPLSRALLSKRLRRFCGGGGVLGHVGRLWAFLALYNFEAYLVTLRQCFITILGNCAVMNENVSATVAANESVSLRVVEPLHHTFKLLHTAPH
jgi:hypothetical protein